jgi:hypothetical protein
MEMSDSQRVISKGLHILLSERRKTFGQILMGEGSHRERPVSMVCTFNEVGNFPSC